MRAKPHIERIIPGAAIAGGELLIHGSGFQTDGARRPVVRFGKTPGTLLVGSENLLVVRVPEAARSGEVRVETNQVLSSPAALLLGVLIAENLHPVANPAIDAAGNIFSTFSGTRGQKVPVSVYKIDGNHQVHPFLTELMNPTGIAFDRQGQMYVSSRQEGIVYQVTPSGQRSVYAEGLGVATGIAFDEEENLYVGDRAGSIFKINRERQIFVFATLESSLAAYHLAFGPDHHLYVTGPTTSSFDLIYRISPRGDVSPFYRGLGRPQGLAFDRQGQLYVVGSLAGHKGIIRITSKGQAEIVVSGTGLVGLAFKKDRGAILATTNAVYELAWDVQGQPLLN